MKFLFVCSGAENLAAELLSAILKQNGHEVELAFDAALFGQLPPPNHRFGRGLKRWYQGNS